MNTTDQDFFKIPDAPETPQPSRKNPLLDLPAPRVVGRNLRIKMLLQSGDEWLFLLIIAALLWGSIAIGMVSSPLAPLTHLLNHYAIDSAQTGTYS